MGFKSFPKFIDGLPVFWFISLHASKYRCKESICLYRMSRNVSISLSFSFKFRWLRFKLPALAMDNEVDWRDIALPCLFRAGSGVSDWNLWNNFFYYWLTAISNKSITLYDCSTSIQLTRSSGVSARRYQTQLLIETSKRHSSNSWAYSLTKECVKFTCWMIDDYYYIQLHNSNFEAAVASSEAHSIIYYKDLDNLIWICMCPGGLHHCQFVFLSVLSPYSTL